MGNILTTVFNAVFKQVTELGGLIFYSIVILSFLIFRELAMFRDLTISLVLMMVFAVAVKYFYFKERPKKYPKNNLLERLDASSFPSIHSMRAFALAFWLSVFFTNIVFTIYLAIIALVVIYSRIYLKKHYLGDVIWGLFFSIIINLGVFLTLR